MISHTSYMVDKMLPLSLIIAAGILSRLESRVTIILRTYIPWGILFKLIRNFQISFQKYVAVTKRFRRTKDMYWNILLDLIILENRLHQITHGFDFIQFYVLQARAHITNKSFKINFLSTESVAVINYLKVSLHK